MTIIWMAAVLVLAVACACWWLARRPLDAAAWSDRRALVRAGLKRRTVPSPAGPQNVFVGGSGPVLMLLHGAGDHAGTWSRVAPALAARHTLVVPDLAGHGASAPATGPIDTGAVVAGLEAVLDRLGGPGPVTVLGNSLGAWMALVLARRHPGRIRLAVAVDGGPLKHQDAGVNLLPRSRAEAKAVLALTRDGSAPPVPDLVLDDMVRRSGTGPMARLAAAAASMEAWLMDEAQLRDLTLPVRLIWGASDRLVPLDYARRLAAALPDAGLVVLDRCGHVPQREAPARFLAALQGLLHEPDPSRS